MELTRRSFVAGAAGAAMGATALSAMQGTSLALAEEAAEPDAGSASDILSANVNVIGEMEAATETHEGDIVVVGAGPGGIACAARAAELGAKVLLLEKLDLIGGTGLYASGNCYISLNSEHQTSQGLEADIPAFYAEWLEAVHYHCDHEVLSTYLRNCGRVVDWLLGYGFEFFMKEVQPTNGLSGNEYRISQPPRDEDTRTIAYGAMLDVVTNAGGEVFYGVTAQEAIVDADGRMAGVRATKEDGTVVDFTGKAVVLATGGYAGNQGMVNALCDVPLLGRDPVINNGEGAKMAWSVGAQKPWNLGILCCDTLYPIDENYKSYSGGIQGIGNVMGDDGKSRLHVNQLGKRFHSEDAFCWVPTYAGANAVAYNEPWLYVIVDQAMLDAFMNAENSTLDQSILEDLIANGVVYQGNSATELAQAVGWDPDTFQTTFDEYNAACEAGVDEVFFKDAKFLVAYGEAPYYAVRFAPTPFGSCGDLAVTPKMEVRGTEPGTTVAGLYAVGSESVGVMHNDYYWALGQTVGWAHTSGVLAAEEICNNVL